MTTLPSVPKTKKRSVTYIPEALPACYAKDKTEPSQSVELITSKKQQGLLSSDRNDVLWMVSRSVGEDQLVSGWRDWVSKTSDRSPVRPSTVAFCPQFNTQLLSLEQSKCCWTSRCV